MIEYTIDRPERLVRVRISGTTTSADLARHYSTVLDDPAYEASFNVLMHIADDIAGPVLGELPNAGLQLEALAKLQHGTKWAVVMAPGFKRLMVEFWLLGIKLGSIQMRFFDDNRMALACLDPRLTARVPENAG